jgi:hypothetical protein
VGLGQKALDGFFVPCQTWLSRSIAVIWLAGLLVYGVHLWGVFYSWGNISFDFLDWAEVTGPRYALLRDAATRGILPLHAANTTALRGVTDRYFSIPDTPFSPQYLLLPFMGTGTYLFYDTLLFYGIGFIGLLLIYRKFRLSPFTFWLLFILFYFNGHITSQLAVGHSFWTCYFLMPYFVLLVFHLVEQQRAGWRWVLGLSLLMLVILSQGYYHMFFYSLLFLGALALFNPRLLKPVVTGGLFVVLVCLPRLLPPTLELSGLTHTYLGGFSSVTDMVIGMIVLQDPARAILSLSNTFPVNVWEIDYYIGLLGFALVVIFGVVLPLWKNHSRNSVQVQILVPSLALAILSIGQMYAVILSLVRIPPFTGERVVSRMFMFPLVFTLVLAVAYLQRELDQRKLPAWVQVVVLVISYLGFNDLMQHMQAWRIRYLDSLGYLFPKVPFDRAQHTLLIRSDPIYTAMLAGGAIVAVLALGFLVWMSIRRFSQSNQQRGSELLQQ